MGSPQPANLASSRAAGILRLGLLVIVAVLYWPLVWSDFGGWDDAMNVAENPRLLPPTMRSVRHYWTHYEGDLYVPVTYTVWSAVARLAFEPAAAGARPTLNPHCFHLLNLLLHAGTTLAALELLRRCVGSDLAAAVGACLFAVHPLQVEPVAWIAGTKDVLSGFLAVVALDRYFSAGRAARFMAAAAFALAMLSKPSAVVVPPIAWVIDRFVFGRSARDATLRVIPLLVLAVPCIIWTRIGQPARAVGDDVPLYLRPLIAADAVAFYLYKLVWPMRLGIDYGRTPQRVIASHWLAWTWIIPCALGGTVMLIRRRAPIVAASMAVLLIALIPVLGLVPFDFQAYSTVADHYMYLAMLGPAMLVAWLAKRRNFAVALVPVILVLAILSYRQARTWRDVVAIHEQALRVNPLSWVSHNQLSLAYTLRDQRDKALLHARAAAAANPQAVLAQFTLAVALANSGLEDQAIAEYRKLLEREPHHVMGRLHLADLLHRAGRTDDAVREYRAVLEIDPANVVAARTIRLLSTTRPANDR